MPRNKNRSASDQSQKEAQPRYKWRTVFDASRMAEGMPPDFLVKSLYQEPGLVRHSQLLMASLWLQSQMAGLICLHDDSDLLTRCTIENGRHLPAELGQATLDMLEKWSSETLRREFEMRFRSKLSNQLREDLDWIPIYRDALSHGYVSLMQQVVGSWQQKVFWSPSRSKAREKKLERLFGGPRREGTYIVIDLSRIEFETGIERVCRVMDFIAGELKEMDIPYPVFA